MSFVSIPIEEYQSLKNEVNLLKNQELLHKLNDVIDILFERKYGLYLGNSTDDLTELSINNMSEWNNSGDVWNEV